MLKNAILRMLKEAARSCLILVIATTVANTHRAQACDEDPEFDPWVEMTMARAIADREPVDTAQPFVAGERVYAWTKVHELEGGTVEHVWRRNDREVARHTMSIRGNHWRTWTRHRLREGRYVIEVVANGEVLARQEIDVTAMEGC